MDEIGESPGYPEEVGAAVAEVITLEELMTGDTYGILRRVLAAAVGEIREQVLEIDEPDMGALTPAEQTLVRDGWSVMRNQVLAVLDGDTP